MKPSSKTALVAAAAALGLAAWPGRTHAVPSFARQTGKSCAACHTVYPELTTYGRAFKLNGYVSQECEQVADAASGSTRLEIDTLAPLSAMLQVGETFVKTPEATPLAAPDGDKHGAAAFPQEFSLFYAGKISPIMGAFIQMTYEQESGAFGFDNTDIRVAKLFQVGGTDLIVGASANNNPTVQDVYNSTPAWGYPYAGGNESVATQIESLGGSVGGLGVYAFWNNLVYAELSAYRTAAQGGQSMDAPDISGYAPYFRAAVQKDLGKHALEIGTYGIALNTVPDQEDPSLAPRDKVSDVAIDAQYQFVGDEHIVTVKGTQITEKQKWNYSQPFGSTENVNDSLTTLKVNGTYYYERMIGASVGIFQTTGSTDAVLYGPSNEFANNSPNSNGWIAEVNYVPWYNTKFTVQYTANTKFNGGTSNYNGADRNASDNNTIMAMAWLMF